jgi:hypothetical protein
VGTVAVAAAAAAAVAAAMTLEVMRRNVRRMGMETKTGTEAMTVTGAENKAGM